MSVVSSESVVSIALAHTGTAASEKSTLVQALHHGCITLVGKKTKQTIRLNPLIMFSPLYNGYFRPTTGVPPSLHIFDASQVLESSLTKLMS